MLKQTVYIPITEFNENTVPIITAKIYGYGQPEEPVMFEKWEGYFLTQEKLKELIGKVWDAGYKLGWNECEYHNCDSPKGDAPTKEEYTKKLLK